jgi:hypothetical protein
MSCNKEKCDYEYSHEVQQMACVAKGAKAKIRVYSASLM